MVLLNNYETLLSEAEDLGLIAKEKPLKAHDGLIFGNRIAIREDITTTTEKACVLSEEIGHHITSCGNILDQTDEWNRKQELRARRWAYDKQIGLSGLIDAYCSHIRTKHDLSLYLDVTEAFLEECLEDYRSRYGICTRLDNYVIYFEPCLQILDMNF